MFIELYKSSMRFEPAIRHFRATYFSANTGIYSLIYIRFYVENVNIFLACGGDFIGFRGTIQSPTDADGSYECIWNIQSSPGNRVKANFE
jgi:hypothetical protein